MYLYFFCTCSPGKSLHYNTHLFCVKKKQKKQQKNAKKIANDWHLTSNKRQSYMYVYNIFLSDQKLIRKKNAILIMVSFGHRIELIQKKHETPKCVLAFCSVHTGYKSNSTYTHTAEWTCTVDSWKKCSFSIALQWNLHHYICIRLACAWGRFAYLTSILLVLAD